MTEGGLLGGANHGADMQGVDGKRVAALIGDGFEEIELAEPRRALEEAGAIVTIVGTDERARQRVRGKRGLDDGQSLKAEELVADCTAEDFDALLIPGGTSPDRIRTDREVQRVVREFDTLKKPMFSIGHGAQVLISAQLVRGRQVTGVHSIADDIRNAGGLYRDQPTVTDSNWVSTRGAEDLPQFNRAMLEKLASAIPAQPVT
ncbi:MAG TPA: type 1 glutamine amidotransferase domain-containing protein [Candidatus Acidoferrum sp.]|jgi:protease I|nr:type 1 glutamine amidotransferase domain-containing protein [Candidatus Acidoferrum sp.]